MPVLKPLAGSPAAPQQHKQPSRKGRKAWRKNVDVSEIEEGLEERTKQIIRGGVVVDRENKDLFQVDEEADANITKQLPKKLKKALKSDEIIARRSAVPALSGRKRSGDSSKTTDGVLSAKRQRTNYVSQKEVIRLRQIAGGHHESTIEIVDASHDPWAVASGAKEVEHNSEGKFSFLPKPSKAKAPETLRRAPISLAANGKAIPAVAQPKAATSYNPLFEEYEAHLAEEGNKAVEAEKKRLAAEEAERLRMEAVARSAAVAEEAERRAELSEWEEDSAWEGFESGVEDQESAHAKRPKRKTPAQRNRIKRRKEAEGKKKHDAVNERKAEQVKKMEELLAEEKAGREALAALSAGSDASDEDEEGDDAVLRRRQLGKFRLPEKDLELVLPDELEDSLRRLKPEGNLLKDRYRSLLVRGKVEARRRRPYHKQAKTKVTEKWAHKDFHLF